MQNGSSSSPRTTGAAAIPRSASRSCPGRSLPALAVAWVRAVPGVTGAIVGARRPSQVDDWIDAGDLELDDETLREIEQLLQ